MIKLTNLQKIYRTKEIETVALENVNLEVQQGEFLSIMGPSGCGKSTLLNIMGLLDLPTSGTVEINGVNTVGMSDKELAAFRNKQLGFVFQSFHLINSLNVLDNVELPLLYRKVSSSERRKLAAVNANNTSSNFDISIISTGKVVELPIPLGFSNLYCTSELSMPFAYSHIIIPCFPNFFDNNSLSVLAKSPIVLILIFESFGIVFLPSINNSETFSVHILLGISFSYNVCTLSGFVKSDAILANNLLCATPTFTVNPNSSFTLFFISYALFINISPHK